MTLTTKTGEQYTGVFSGAALEPSKPQYILKMTRRSQQEGQSNGVSEQSGEYVGEGEDHAMSFEIQDTVDLFVADVTTAPATSQQNGRLLLPCILTTAANDDVGSAGSFLTDTQISSKEANAGRARELQRWDAGAEAAATDMSLGDPNDRSWDQFAANERLYGVQSTYDENMYTTAIDRNTPEFRRKQAEADRIAREIEGSAPANAHIAEERRRDANRDDGGDEEDKYSGVIRESALPKRAQGAYVPPSQRPITGAPSVSGAPFDPAIISSQLKAPASASPTPPTGQSTAPKVAVESEAAPKKKEGTTEDRVRDTADAFKVFANNEKLRIRAAQEAKRNNVRQEKNVKLNDLKKFAANFKLKSRVPDDLVPILAKDREKQLEIQSKAEEAAKEEELRSKDTDKMDKTGSVAASPVPSISTSQAGPSAPDSRQQFNTSRAARSSQSGRGGAGPPPLHPGQMPPHAQGQAPRQPLSQRIGANNNLARQGMPPDIRVPPTGPSASPAEGLMSPQSATRLNVNAKAFEFRPAAAKDFTPIGASPSPQRAASHAPAEAAATFFDKDKPKTAKPFPASYDPLKRMANADYTAAEKKKYASNGGFPQAYSTFPTWQTPKSNEGVSYISAFPTAQSLAGAQGPSPMQTPSSNPQMSHAHQLPAHMHPQGMQGPPHHRQQQFYPQQHGPGFDPRLQQQHFGPNGSVQNSPRAQQMPVAPFNNQMPPMPQHFPGQPMPPGYGMSPSMQYRQPHMQGPMMMMPGQPQGQSKLQLC